MSGRIRITIAYFIVFLFAFERCAYNDINIEFNCDDSTLAISLVSSSNTSSCRSIDGAVTVSASGGLEPYDFKINDGEYQTNAVFTNLGAGTYTVRVKDKNNCWRELEVSISAAGSTLNATVVTSADSQCGGNNGKATINATGGTPPYQYQLNSAGYGSGNVFEGLNEGPHVVVIKDAEDCQRTVSVRIDHGITGISYATQVKSIITTSCAKSGCHDAGSGTRDWTDFAKLKANAVNVKTRVQNRTMPPDNPLSQADINLISCWIDDGAPNN